MTMIASSLEPRKCGIVLITKIVVGHKITKKGSIKRPVYTLYQDRIYRCVVSTKMEAISTFQGYLLRSMSKDLTQAQCTTEDEKTKTKKSFGAKVVKRLLLYPSSIHFIKCPALRNMNGDSDAGSFQDAC